MNVVFSDSARDQVERATRILVPVDNARPHVYEAARAAAVEAAATAGAELVFYDRTDESYFIDPYPHGLRGRTFLGISLAGSEDMKGPNETRLLDTDDLRGLGRHHVVEMIDDARSHSIDAHGWLPVRFGPKGMRECLARFGIDFVVLPESFESPRLVDRVRQDTLARFRRTLSVPILVAGADGHVRTAHEPISAAAD